MSKTQPRATARTMKRYAGMQGVWLSLRMDRNMLWNADQIAVAGQDAGDLDHVGVGHALEAVMRQNHSGSRGCGPRLGLHHQCRNA